ncbi:MAG: hypothetical protein ACYCO5_11460 [Acidobacteriaceae bacterium]
MIDLLHPHYPQWLWKEEIFRGSLAASLLNALKQRPEIQANVFEALQRITPAEFFSEGRVYGGGLHKVEPKELAQLSARTVIEAIGPDLRIERQGRLCFAD